MRRASPPPPDSGRTIPAPCPTCGGSRRIVAIVPGMPPGLDYMHLRCTTCQGTGANPAAPPDPLAPGPWDALDPHPQIRTPLEAAALAGEIVGVR